MIVSTPAVAEYVGRKVGQVLVEPFTALGIERDGEVVAGVVFNVWTGPDVQMTIAAEPGCVSRPFLRRVGRYATEELGCIRATIETEQSHVVDLALRMGGQVEGVKRDLFGEGRDGIVIGILKKDWFLR
jgi:hypothetical protein